MLSAIIPPSSSSQPKSVQSLSCFKLIPDLFTEVFPFHLVFNRNREIIQVGDVLQKIYPELSTGSQLEQHFRVDRPNIGIEFDQIRKRTRSLFLLESLQNGMKLKGQMVYVEQSDILFFLCSPWVTDIASLKSYRITLSDFAIHDPVVDFLFLLQAQNTALSDAKKLTDELTRQRSELRQTNQRLSTLYAVTHILAESATFGEATIKILAAIGTALDWQVGVLWLVDPSANVLKCQGVWTAVPEHFKEFELLTRMLTLPMGIGLAGCVWHEREPIWIENIVTDSNSPCRLHAIEAKLQGGFGLPIQNGTEVIGVLEFFSHKSCQPDDNLLEMMVDIGIKVGQFNQRKQIEAALLKQTEISESLKSILDSMGDAVIVADENRNFLVFNPAAERMFGSTAKHLVENHSVENHSVATKCSQTLNFYLPDRQTPFNVEDLPLERSIRGEKVNDVEMFVCHAQTPDGVWVTATGRPLKDKNEVLRGGVIVCRDISERKRVEEQLIHDALHDGLTGLANRALFMERLGQAIALTKRQEGCLFAVLFLDLDRFKVINDSLGHIIGDQLLIAISRRLENCLRRGDLIARLGGDEFAILLEDIQDSSYVIQVAERLQEELMLPFHLGRNEIFASTSIGIALNTTGYEHPQELLRDADTAMYHAKSMGKAQYQIFDTAMHVRAVALLQLETDLRRAIERQEFQLHYQPIVALESQKIIGFEALIRWVHPERGLIFPGEFISVAEETGLIIPLGGWVLQEACRQMQHWKQEFPVAHNLAISVNISGKQFSQTNFIVQIQQILQETGMDAHRLNLEITESILMENVEFTTSTLLELQALGIQLSMDDFGTGYSSLSYLSRFPVNTLKIDRSFIQSVDTDAEKLEIIRTVVLLAQSLGMDAVAEGIETAPQLARLRELQCESGQGYFFSVPLDSKMTEKLLTAELIA
ncbi:MAG: EAL domain-containing protein [Drouetiella hepatica Uher 2000/2452]|jgi:diguanylate cyclase (GGDEF)-like protein/PAS domain S-box-containing protein|uniref:guanylate cyclase n=1 Tax=Drouetiella hepatica Uher 2000/2452 TaxID=904376 RepID=A0A951Q6I4_9CYAN|nr:EAL domain-containing protein [Drouetiella hepatica Uher 2000/2452]